MNQMMSLQLKSWQKEYYKERARSMPIVQQVKCDDVITFRGQSVPVFVYGEDGFIEDKPIGEFQLIERMLRKQGIGALAFPAHKIIKIDGNNQVSLNKEFKIYEYIINNLQPYKNYIIELYTFARQLAQTFSESQEHAENIELVKFSQQVLKVIYVENENQNKTELSAIQSNNEDLLIHLLKLSNYYKHLSQATKETINSLFSKIFPDQSFSQYLRSAKSKISIRKVPSSSKIVPKWFGVKQGIELLPKPSEKSIIPEILNQKYLWVRSYHHYSDWKETFANAFPLNSQMLLQQEPLDGEFYFFGRRQEYGLLPSIKTNPTLDPEVQLKCNLQNLKYRIKKELSDQDIVEQLLTRDFIQKLIRERFGEKGSSTPQQLQRSPEAFYEFLKEIKRSPEKMDPYVQYFRKLYAQKHMGDELFQMVMDRYKQISNDPDIPWYDKKQMKADLMNKYMEADAIIDQDNLERETVWGSEYRKLEFTTKIDKDSLMHVFYPQSIDNDITSAQTSADLLQLKRQRAETNFIKLSIIYKLHNNSELSRGETAFLHKWIEAVEQTGIAEAGDAFISQETSNFALSDLSAKDLQWLNSFYGVQIKGEQLKFSLSDLLLELSHFLDNDVVRRFELLLIERKELAEWGIEASENSVPKLDPTLRNKEIWLTNAAIDELSWREGGRWNEEDVNNFFTLYGRLADRNYALRKWYQLDQQSFKAFLSSANDYDERHKFVKEWYRRKEYENLKKQNPPQGKFNKPDHELHEDYTREVTEIYKQDLENMLNLPWEDMTEGSLQIAIDDVTNQLYSSNKFITRRNLEIINLILRHPNLHPQQKEGFQTLLRYQKIAIDQPRLLAEKPVELRGSSIPQEVSEKDWEESVLRARADYIGPVIQRALSATKR